MSSETLSIAELEDKDGVVYAIGIGRRTSEEVTQYLYSPDFEGLWNQTFEKSDYIMIPGYFDGIVQIEASDVDEIKELMGVENTKD
jgi:hypothetical protein